MKRRRWTMKQKTALLARMEELLKRPGMTVRRAAMMLDLHENTYRQWLKGRGYAPNKPKTFEWKQVPDQADIARAALAKAAKGASAEAEIKYTVTLVGDMVRLECRQDQLSEVLSRVTVVVG